MEDNNPNVIVVESKKRINWLAAALVAVIIMILFGWCRGYRNGIKSENDIKVIQEANKNLQKLYDNAVAVNEKYKDDSLKQAEAYNELQITQHQLLDTLEKSEVQNAYLAQRIKKAEGKVDTIELINDCQDLADAYLRELGINEKYRIASDSVRANLQSKIKTQADKAADFQRKFDSCINIAKPVIEAASNVSPKFNIKVGASGLYNPFIRGIGPLIIAEDKKGNIYGGSVKFTNHGKLYEAQYAKTISFRRKR